ncbi:unnamed protein product [Paramecium octaurelia]|uniref:Transmembrane protein n=1 Tax=Paramecium octaurelia TaxID=43137 RepID=A0A8S1TNP3_PAROT|nr:unnamed protein product [Paramecium octaurelia]
MIAFIIFQLLYSAQNTKVSQPNITTYSEVIPPSNFSNKVRQTRQFGYTKYPGVFAISLKETFENNTEQSADLNGLEIEETQFGTFSGCYSTQRNIDINFNLQLQLEQLLTQPWMHFTDLATADNKFKAYIVRNDYSIFQIDISTALGEISLHPKNQSFNNLLIHNTSTVDQFYMPHPYLIDDEGSNKIYAITELGGVSFSTDGSIGDAKMESEEIQLRRHIYNVHKNSRAQIIIIACGSEGIDLYDIQNNGKIKHRAQLTPEQLGIEDGIIIDVDSNDDETKIYLLDSESGLYIYDISDLNNITQIMSVLLPNTKTFDHYQNTFFLIAKTNTQLYYAVEIFVDFQTKSYYYNNLYIDEMIINNVNVFEHYAVLIGDDGHKIIYHSIYNKFINPAVKHQTYFQEENLLKIKEYDFSKFYNSSNRIMIGIAKHAFKYIEISFEDPKITCQSNEVVQKSYVVTLNSTQCENKTTHADHSPYSLCQLTHSFVYQSEYNPGNKSVYASYTITIYALVVGIIWLIIVISYLYKRWAYKLEFLKWRKQKLIVTQPFNSELEMPNQNN